MIILRWALFPEATDIDHFNIYRSIIGFSAPIISIPGKTLQLKINGGNVQTFTFSSDPLVDTINSSIVNGQAYLNDGGTSFLVRSDVRQAPGSVEIIGGTALGDLGLTTRLITEKSEDELIATAPAPALIETLVEYEDLDGSLSDWYAVSAVTDSGDESKKTNYRQPITATGPICVIEGLVITPQGVRVPDAEVTCEIQIPPEEDCNYATVTKETITVCTGSDGRFSLPVLQKLLVQINIPATSFTKMISVPEVPYVFLNKLQVDLDYQFKG